MRVFFHLEGEHERVIPDGFAMDTEGHLWSAVFGSGKINRISPEGKIVEIVHLPTKNLTCGAFIGDELFITTAKPTAYQKGMHDEMSLELAGDLFRFKVGYKGKTTNAFKYNSAQ